MSKTQFTNLSQKPNDLLVFTWHIMTEMKDYILTTERLRLRRLSRDDEPYVLSACQTPGFNDGMTWEPVKTIEQAHIFTDYANDLWNKGEKFVWTIEDKNNASFIGRIELGQDDKLGDRIWGLGYWIHPTQQGKGYATEATHEAIRFAFETLHADSIVSSHHDWNEASGRVLTKAGMKRIGFSEGRTIKHRKPVRSVEFWLDRKDWIK